MLVNKANRTQTGQLVKIAITALYGRYAEVNGATCILYIELRFSSLLNRFPFFPIVYPILTREVTESGISKIENSSNKGGDWR